MRYSLLFLIIFWSSVCSAQLNPCYNIDGDLISQIPCDPSANVSACCAPGGACATNFYCHGADANDTFDRVGGCTDKTGADPACPFPFLRGMPPYCHFGSGIGSVLAYSMPTQTLPYGIGLATNKTLLTVVMEHFVCIQAMKPAVLIAKDPERSPIITPQEYRPLQRRGRCTTKMRAIHCQLQRPIL